ncbi:ribonuclease [Rhizobium sp. Root708]|uniref:YihY/virulence factor BrkB family protein n=1 Tax=Rhizobium sp. Root708 TaxID=1736592 RepID=UPI0006FA8448|nr:YihY/virulence factor BrkB family protein [Rhizobium sp. Root708]KRB55207.1 ribonuclease [Rhizobium sp. Root708]
MGSRTVGATTLLVFSVGLIGLVALARSGSEVDVKEVSDPPDRGRDAATPEAIPYKGLRDVLWRVMHEVAADRVTLIAAGVTFYLLLALFPGLAALVAIYGLVADPVAMADHLRELSGMLPPGAFDLIADRIADLVETRSATLGFTFVAGLAVALWSIHSATLAVFEAMNVAYEETEKRGFIKLNVIGFCFTLCVMLAAIVVLGLVAVMPLVLSYFWLDQFKENLALVLRWPLLVLIVTSATTAVYRFGPSREPARVRWMTWGAVLVTVSWFVMSLGFSFYLDHFANYSASYGTLGALIGFLIWAWLSVMILIVGGELNAELEHQTARDTTTGPPLPMGSRGAYVADTLGKAWNS